MDFIDRIRELSARIPKQLPHVQTEEATKHSLVMPFIHVLGYDVFDPTEVTPELNADVGIKKGEKVDYAILKDGQPVMLFECKWHGADLDNVHMSQLYRYFSVTEARFGVLTNGIIYRFYTDLEAQNKMDSKPFFEFNLLDFKDRHVNELKKFSKSAFDVDNIITTASELKYTRAIKRIIAEEMEEPSDEFARFFAAQVYSGRLTQPVRLQFRDIVKGALDQHFNDRINRRLESALAGEQKSKNDKVEETEVAEEQPEEEQKPKVSTTEEELQAYYIVKAILSQKIDPARVVMRDVQTYCGVLLDDNNRQPLCRLHFNASQKQIGLFDEDKNEERVPIGSLDEIYKYGDRIRAAVAYYD